MPCAANIGECRDSGPYSNSTTNTSGERISSVTPAPKSPRCSGSGKVARWTTAYVCSPSSSRLRAARCALPNPVAARARRRVRGETHQLPPIATATAASARQDWAVTKVAEARRGSHVSTRRIERVQRTRLARARGQEHGQRPHEAVDGADERGRPATDPDSSAHANATHVAEAVTIVVNAEAELHAESGAVDPAPVRREPVLLDLAPRPRDAPADASTVEQQPGERERARSRRAPAARARRTTPTSPSPPPSAAPASVELTMNAADGDRRSAGSGPAPRAG